MVGTFRTARRAGNGVAVGSGARIGVTTVSGRLNKRMRKTTKFGLGLLVVGSALVLVATGGFHSTTADRGMDIGIEENDAEAFFGLEESQGETIVLNHTDADRCFIGCVYPDENLMDLSDNIGSISLEVEDFGYTTSGDDIVYDSLFGNGVRIEGQLSDDSAVVRGDFMCPAPWGGDQQEAESTIMMTFEVSGGSTTIELTRQIDVECEPE